METGRGRANPRSPPDPPDRAGIHDSVLNSSSVIIQIPEIITALRDLDGVERGGSLPVSSEKLPCVPLPTCVELPLRDRPVEYPLEHSRQVRQRLREVVLHGGPL